MDATALAMYGIRIGAITSLVAALLGVLAVLISTFIAEPIKISAQNKANLANLRLALYKEIMFNYLYIHEIPFGNVENYPRVLPLVGDFALRTECHKQAVSDGQYVFYQLDEANLFNRLYAMINVLINFRAKTANEIGVPIELQVHAIILKDMTVSFLLATRLYFRGGMLDKKILKQIVTSKEYAQILNDNE